MTSVGKVLILLFGAASLACLMTAIAIYTQKMDFVTPKGADARKAPARVDKQIARTKQLLQANNRAFTRWVEGFDQVCGLELDQYERRDFYSGQIELALTGQLDGKAVVPAVQTIQYQEDPIAKMSMVKISQPTGRPPELDTARPSKPLEPPFKSIQDIVAAHNEVMKLLQEGLKLLEKESALTREIIGSENPLVKGLRTKIKEQEHIGEIADDERIFLENTVTARRIDVGLISKQLDQLNARIARLAGGAAKKQPVQPKN